MVALIITVSHYLTMWELCPLSSALLHPCGCSSTEDLHHQGDRGYRRREQEQLGGAGCHHHQREESASTVGERQLQRGHTREHGSRHTRRGTLGWGVGGVVVVVSRQRRQMQMYSWQTHKGICTCLKYKNSQGVFTRIPYIQGNRCLKERETCLWLSCRFNPQRWISARCSDILRLIMATDVPLSKAFNLHCERRAWLSVRLSLD